MSNITDKLKYILTNLYLIVNFTAFIVFSTWNFLIYFNYIDNRVSSDSLYTRSNLIQFGINFAFIGICLWNLIRYFINSFKHRSLKESPTILEPNIQEVVPVIAEVVELPQKTEK